MQATQTTSPEERAGEDGIVLDGSTFDAFADATTAAAAPQRARRRRGGPLAPLPLLPLIGLVAGIGIAYVAQTAHITQASYQESALAAQQADLQRQAAQLDDELARLRSPARIDAAAQRLGLHPPSKWVYVAAVPAPIAAPAISADRPASSGAGALDHVVEAMAGSFGSSGNAGRASSAGGRAP